MRCCLYDPYLTVSGKDPKAKEWCVEHFNFELDFEIVPNVGDEVAIAIFNENKLVIFRIEERCFYFKEDGTPISVRLSGRWYDSDFEEGPGSEVE